MTNRSELPLLSVVWRQKDYVFVWVSSPLPVVRLFLVLRIIGLRLSLPHIVRAFAPRTASSVPLLCCCLFWEGLVRPSSKSAGFRDWLD